MSGRLARTVVVWALIGAGACGPSAPVVAPASSTPSTSSTSIVPRGQGFSDADHGRSATVVAGQRITVILHSSDFVFAPPSDPSVLREDGPPTVTDGGASCTDAAGAGCGTVVTSFVAVRPGAADLRADRRGCIEPACPPDAAHWELHLQVVGTAPPGSTSSTLGDPPPPTTTTTLPPAPAHESGVRGTVHFSPVCPVERVPPDPACAPRAGPADIELVGPDGAVAASARAGDDGAFVLPVAPGRYTLRASPAGPGIGGGCRAEPEEVTVEPGAEITVAVSCDTGIR